jgi:gamma-glutamyltranspeptidase/glutathione hydrolase
VLDEGEPIMATGTLGGQTIPGLVVQVVSNVLDQGMPIQEAVDAPRFSLNLPQNTANWNSWFPATTIAGLRALGDRFAPDPVADAGLGSASSLHVDLESLSLTGAADRRLSDASAIVLPRGATP